MGEMEHRNRQVHGRHAGGRTVHGLDVALVTPTTPSVARQPFEARRVESDTAQVPVIAAVTAITGRPLGQQAVLCPTTPCRIPVAVDAGHPFLLHVATMVEVERNGLRRKDHGARPAIAGSRSRRTPGLGDLRPRRLRGGSIRGCRSQAAPPRGNDATHRQEPSAQRSHVTPAVSNTRKRCPQLWLMLCSHSAPRRVLRMSRARGETPPPKT